MVGPADRCEPDVGLQRPVEQLWPIVSQCDRRLQDGQRQRGHRHATVNPSVAGIEVPTPQPHAGSGPRRSPARHRHVHSGRARRPQPLPPSGGNTANCGIRTGPQRGGPQPRLSSELMVARKVDARIDRPPAPIGDPLRDPRPAQPAGQRLTPADDPGLPSQHILNTHDGSMNRSLTTPAADRTLAGQLSTDLILVHSNPS